MTHDNNSLNDDTDKRSASSIVALLIQGVMLLYFVSFSVMAPYYNWQYAKENGFMKWLLFGEIVATAKSVVWPYFVFISNKENADEVKTKEKFSDNTPQSVLRFLRSTDIAIDAIEEARSNSNEKSEKLERCKSLIHSSIEIAVTVDVAELNNIYPDWGTHFSKDFIPGMKLLLEAMETNDKVVIANADASLIRWNQWIGQHGMNIKAEIQKRYGIQEK